MQVTVPTAMRGYLNRLKNHSFDVELYFSTDVIMILASKPGTGVNVWINGDQEATFEINYDQTIFKGASAIDDAIDRAIAAT